MDVLTAAHVVDTDGNNRYEPSIDGIPLVRTSRERRRQNRLKDLSGEVGDGAPGYRQIFHNGQFVRADNDLAILHLETYENDAVPATLNRSVPYYDQPIEMVGFGKIGTINPPVEQNSFNVRHVG